MKKELKLNNIKQLFADYPVAEVKKVGADFMVTVNHTFLFMPSFAYGFIGGEIIPPFLPIADSQRLIQSIMHGVGLSASSVRYLGVRYEDGDDFKIYHAVDPLRADEYTHIHIHAEWNALDGTDGINLARLRAETDAILLRKREDEYGLKGECEFLLPTNNLVRYELVRDYRAHLRRLIEAGDKYYEDFDRRRPRYFADLIEKVEILRQLDCWELAMVGKESLIAELKITGEKVEMRYDSVGMMACEQLLNRYRKE